MEKNLNASNPLGSEKISQLLLKFSVPTVMTLMVSYLYNIVDQIFVGRGVGVLGIAATNVAFPFTTLCMAIALMIGDGCASNISLSLGRQEQDKANQCFGSAFAMLLLFGILIVVAGSIFVKPLVVLFGATDSVFQYAVDYSKIIIFGLPFLVFNVAFTGIIRADGNPGFTMKSMMLGALINLILDPIFIFYFNMGMKGAAIATIIGQIVSGLICLSYVRRLKNIQFKKEFLSLRPKHCASVVALGAPSFATQISNFLVQIVMNNIMKNYGAFTAYGSDIALSCYGMMMKVYQIAHAMFVGVCSGTQPINGYNYGAKQYGRVKQTYTIAVIVAFVISIFWFLIYQLIPGQISNLFVKNDALYTEFAAYCFRIYMMAFFVYGFPMATASFFQSIGKPMIALIISLSRQILFLIPLSLLLSKNYGLIGGLYAAPIADGLTFVLALIFIQREYRHWKKKEMI